MKTLFNKGYTGVGQLGIFLAMWGGGFIAGSLVAVGLWSIMTGQGIMNMEQDMLNPANATAVKVLQMTTTLFAFFAPAVLYAFIVFRNGWDALGFEKAFNWRTAGVVVLILLSSGPLIDAVTELNKAIPLPANAKAFFDKLEKSYEQQVKVIGQVKTFGQFVSSLFLIAVLPAVFEEVLFRGGMQGLFTRWWKSPWAAIIVTSILFSAIHGSWYGFIPRIMLGVMLGSIFYLTGNLWYSILAHMLNNAIVVSYMYYMHLSGEEASLSPESVFPVWSAVVTVVAWYFLYRWLWQQKKYFVPQERWFDRTNPFEKTDLLA
jgi:membrane protease YdiL (CAAX protease family)